MSVVPSEQPDPVLAVVIPAYRQPEFLKDAVLSSLRQTLRAETRVVIVDDGCPYASTIDVGRFFADAYPGEVFYLRQRHGGLSAARNEGIRFALWAWPSVRAVFPLDADNRLSPSTLEKLWCRLEDADAPVGWVYQDLALFGAEQGLVRTGFPFSIFRLAHENLCDAGSLIRRSVFERGIWYDERLATGYEDWEFYLHAGLEGFQGLHEPDTGFGYRKHGHSLLADARRRHAATAAAIATKHRKRLRESSLALEHRELPRFLIVDPDGRARFATDPLEPAARELTLDECAAALARWEVEAEPKQQYVPPVLVSVPSTVVDVLREARLLRGLLFLLQGRLARRGSVGVALRVSESPFALELTEAGGEAPALVATTFLQVLADARRMGVPAGNGPLGGAGGADLLLSLGRGHVRSAAEGLDNPSVPGAREGLAELVRGVARRLPAPRESGVEATVQCTSHSAFALAKHVNGGRTSFPRVRGGREKIVVFATGWLRLGGIEQIVLSLARGLRKTTPVTLHLVVTAQNAIEAHPTALAAFDDVTFLGGGTGDEHLLRDVLREADAVVNAHSEAAYRLLPAPDADELPRVVSILQVLERDERGRPGGYPLLACREYADLVDHFVVPSSRMRRTCLGLGVPPEKIVVVPNAPAVAPPTTADAIDIAQEKGTRSFGPDRPIRVLFAGRFDYQKGFDRLPGVARRLQELGVPFELRLVGKALSRSGAPDVPGAVFSQPTSDPSELTRHYREADCFVLPSRFEGVPLALLEAMAFGNVVVASRVGAVDEAVEDGTTGVLVDAEAGDEAVSESVAAAIADIATRPERYRKLRIAAAQSAMANTWEGAAASLAGLVAGRREAHEALS